MRQTVGSDTTNYLWDEFSAYGDVVRETNGTGTELANYTLANQQLIGQVRGGVANYYVQDGQGSTRALTNATGDITDTYNYLAYGQLYGQTGTTTNPYLYTGQQFDSVTGLYDLRARYYDPGVGRFLSRDTYPINYQNPVELNRYGYTANNPVNRYDPTGWMALTDMTATQTETKKGSAPLAEGAPLSEFIPWIPELEIAYLNPIIWPLIAIPIDSWTTWWAGFIIAMAVFPILLAILNALLGTIPATHPGPPDTTTPPDTTGGPTNQPGDDSSTNNNPGESNPSNPDPSNPAPSTTGSTSNNPGSGSNSDTETSTGPDQTESSTGTTTTTTDDQSDDGNHIIRVRHYTAYMSKVMSKMAIGTTAFQIYAEYPITTPRNEADLRAKYYSFGRPANTLNGIIEFNVDTRKYTWRKDAGLPPTANAIEIDIPLEDVINQRGFKLDEPGVNAEFYDVNGNRVK